MAPSPACRTKRRRSLLRDSAFDFHAISMWADPMDPEKFRRLVALKDKYDPDNLFHLNQNIKPSSRDGAAS